MKPRTVLGGVSDLPVRMDVTFGAITRPAVDMLNFIRKRAAAMRCLVNQYCSNLTLKMYAVAVTVTLLHEQFKHRGELDLVTLMLMLRVGHAEGARVSL